MNELLSDDKKLIAIKDEAMDLPVVCAVGPKGVEVLLDKPASSAAISTYVQRRALDYGLPAGITHYAWRRSAGECRQKPPMGNHIHQSFVN